jgi:hypothetical protein
MYTQVIGKLRLALSPFEPQWAHVPLYVTARGLTTSTLPVDRGTFDAELDLISHQLVIRTSDGRFQQRPLGGDVAAFYHDVIDLLGALDIRVVIKPVPQEVDDPIPFPDDHVHGTYVPEHANRFFQVLSRVDVVFKEHRARFRGRTSPVHFFWGTFDMALTRYSGRPLPPPSHAGLLRRVGGDAELICAGWWPGDQRVQHAAFYAYGYPQPAGIEQAAIAPEQAAWSASAGEFLLPYDAVREAAEPPRLIHEFLETTYSEAARLMDWNQDLVPA